MSLQRKIDETCEAAALYALGCLPPDEARGFESRLKGGCLLCNAQLAESRVVSDALAAAPTPVRPPHSLRARLLASLPGIEQCAGPGPTEGRIVVRKDETPWDASPHPGVEYRPLLGEKTYLVRMKPGAQFPAHVHKANEQCLVVDGSLTDAEGLTVRAGDYVFMPVHSQHSELRSDAGCVLLIAYS